MDDNVIKFFTATSANDVVEQCKDRFESVLILGWDKEGMLDARATLDMNRAETVHLCQFFLHKLMNGDFDQ